MNKKTEKQLADTRRLTIRNIAAAAAFALFITSLFVQHKYAFQSIAYLVGAVAYFSELVILSDGFKKKLELRESLMPLLFFVLYIILCVSHFLEHIEM